MKLNLILTIVALPFLAFSQCIKGDCINGPGVMKGENFTYNGDFLNGVFHGIGEIKQKDYKYVGGFLHSLRNGKGKEFQKNQLVYDGNFLNSQKNGYGKLYKDKKLQYEGEFKYGTPHGFGTAYFDNLSNENDEVTTHGDIRWSGNFEHGQMIESSGNYNFQNTFDPSNIISDYDKVVLVLEKEERRAGFYYNFYFSNNLNKKFLFDSGNTGVSSFSKDDFLELKKNGLKYKKIGIKSSAKQVDGTEVPFTYYEFYNLKLDDIIIKKQIVAVRDSRGGDTIIGLGFLESFPDYIMPNKEGKMTLLTK